MLRLFFHDEESYITNHLMTGEFCFPVCWLLYFLFLLYFILFFLTENYQNPLVFAFLMLTRAIII